MGMPGREARSDHHRRIGRRRAARDGGDGKRAVTQLVPAAVLARDAPALAHVRVAVGGARGLEALLEARGGHAVMGTRGAGKRELDTREVKFDDAGIATVLARAEHALGASVGLHELDV